MTAHTKNTLLRGIATPATSVRTAIDAACGMRHGFGNRQSDLADFADTSHTHSNTEITIHHNAPDTTKILFTQTMFMRHEPADDFKELLRRNSLPNSASHSENEAFQAIKAANPSCNVPIERNTTALAPSKAALQ